MSERIPQRNEIPAEHKWSIEDLYATDAAWEQDLSKAKEFPAKIASYKGLLSTDSAKLLEYLKYDDDMTVILENMINYAQRKNDEDTREAKYQDMVSRLEMLFVDISGASAFVTPEILSISDETMERFYKEQPGMELYRLCIDRVRRRKAHILSEAEERIMALSGDMTNSPDTIFSMLDDADMKFPDAVDKDGNKHQVTHGSYIPLMHSNDRALRKSAFESLYGVYENFKNTSAAVLASQVKCLTFNARARRYESTLEAALSGNEVPVEVYKQLIEAVHENMDYMYKYVKLRKKLLGVDELHAYDLYAPIVSDIEVKIPFDQAKQEVYDSLAPMGEDYRAIFREGIENRWIDIYENEGKRGGAYSAGGDPHPYVLLNQKDTLDSMFTIAHEMGHSLHTYYSMKNQPTAYANYVIFVAEVASTCNEVLLVKHLLANTTDKKERAYLINHFLEQFRGTVYRQTMFAEFELWMNEHAEKGETLTADMMCDAYYELNKKYFGDGMTVDRLISVEWARIPHFFYNFYVFQYATGFSAAVAIANRILTEGKPAVEDYIKFLSAGSSMDPISVLKIAGVDMTTAQPVNDALKLFNELIDEMAALAE